MECDYVSLMEDREELRKLGVAMSQEEKGKILNGNHDLIFKIISRLR